MKSLLFVGCFTHPLPHAPKAAGKGVVVYQISEEGNELNATALGTTEAGISPAFLFYGPATRRLYVCNEKLPNEGTLQVFNVSPDGRTLTKQCVVSSSGIDPCYILLDPEEKSLLLTNYTSGSALTLAVDGPTPVMTDKIQFEGASMADPSRQEGPHAHCIIPNKAHTFVLVPDLGVDAIYSLDLGKNASGHRTLSRSSRPRLDLKPGTGPRHLELHPSEAYAYVTGELDGTVHVLGVGNDGSLSHRQSLTTLPEGWKGFVGVADIHLSPDARFLLVSTRGPNSVAVYSVSPDGSQLKFVEFVSSGGETPRNFAFSPSGRFVLVGNQDTDNIAVFSFNAETGHLSYSHDIKTPAPVCLKFAPY